MRISKDEKHILMVRSALSGFIQSKVSLQRYDPNLFEGGLFDSLHRPLEYFQ